MSYDGPRELADPIQRERDLWIAFAARDRSRLEELIDSNAIDIGTAGIKNRDEILDAVARMEITAFELVDIRCVRVSPGVEIVTYRATVDGTYRGVAFPARNVLATSVWVLQDCETWRLVHRVEVPSRAATNYPDEPEG